MYMHLFSILDHLLYIRGKTERSLWCVHELSVIKLCLPTTEKKAATQHLWITKSFIAVTISCCYATIENIWETETQLQNSDLEKIWRTCKILNEVFFGDFPKTFIVFNVISFLFPKPSHKLFSIFLSFLNKHGLIMNVPLTDTHRCDLRVWSYTHTSHHN